MSILHCNGTPILDPSKGSWLVRIFPGIAPDRRRGQRQHFDLGHTVSGKSDYKCAKGVGRKRGCRAGKPPAWLRFLFMAPSSRTGIWKQSLKDVPMYAFGALMFGHLAIGFVYFFILFTRGEPTSLGESQPPRPRCCGRSLCIGVCR